MATIDYKEKYEKAVQAAMLAKQHTESAVTIGILEEIFPELKDEDERIRKELLQIANESEDSFYMVMTPNKRERLIAWLEKQGEQKPTNKVEPKDYNSIDPHFGKPIDKVEPKFNVGDEIKTSNEELLTITKIDEKGYWSDDLFICGFDDAAKWELVGQKPAWSEEDKKMIRGLIVICDEWTTRHSFYPIENCEIEKLKNWLYSLKERCTWKPSDEQMKALQEAVIEMGKSVSRCSIEEFHEIESLYNDLKKLKV